MFNHAYTPKSCWDVYTSADDIKAMDALADRYVDFLSRCKTEREVVSYAMERLAKAGYSAENFSREKAMKALHGKALFVVRRGKKLVSSGLRMLGAHADSPRLDFKQHPLLEQCNIGQAKTHYYGGIHKYQWFARPLAIHGVIIKQDGTRVDVSIGDSPKEPVFTISDLLPHLAQGQAEKTLAKAFEGEKMNLVLGHQPLDKSALAKKVRAASKKSKSEDNCPTKSKDQVKAHILALFAQKYGIIEEDFYSAELQAVPAGPARYVGLDSALIGGYGQDDRINVFCALEALLDCDQGHPEHTQCLVFWDKEEIGSEGSTGAKSRFFEYCVKDLIAAWEPKARFSDAMMATKAISADVHAAIDPDWQELHEKLNAALIGNGPCFCKYTGSRGKYMANDAHPEYVAWLRGLLNKHNIPWQMAQLGKVDGGGGGTVAMHLAEYGMDIIDCGPPVLSMHSPFELSSKVDIYATTLAFSAFLKS